MIIGLAMQHEPLGLAVAKSNLSASRKDHESTIGTEIAMMIQVPHHLDGDNQLYNPQNMSAPLSLPLYDQLIGDVSHFTDHKGGSSPPTVGLSSGQQHNLSLPYTHPQSYHLTPAVIRQPNPVQALYHQGDLDQHSTSPSRATGPGTQYQTLGFAPKIQVPSPTETLDTGTRPSQSQPFESSETSPIHGATHPSHSSELNSILSFVDEDENPLGATQHQINATTGNAESTGVMHRGDLPNEHTESSEGSGEYADNIAEVKLFVGQVPKSMSEEDVLPIFNSFGSIKEVTIIRDKMTGLHKGCAFVTFWSPFEAQKAQEALHDKYIFPGAKKSVQVKPAELSATENKLFVGMLSRSAEQSDVHELFSPFGEIRDIIMIRFADGSSKCAAFLRFVDRESAKRAIDELNNNVVMEGAVRPLIVKFADTKHQRLQRQLRHARNQDFIAAVGPAGYPVYSSSIITPLSSHYQNHNKYDAVPELSYGHHITHPHHDHGLPLPHSMPHAHHPYLYAPQGYGAISPLYDNLHHGAGVMAGVGHHVIQPIADHSQAVTPKPREGPAGANLFIYHLPHDLADIDLATAFNPFGNVLSAKVFVDKYTGESKGFGFVSYDSVISAETAIEQMNGFKIGSKRLKVQHKRVHGSSLDA